MIEAADIEDQLVPDPFLSDSEFIYQRRRKPDNPNVGKVTVQRNMRTLIGGLVTIRRRTRLHEKVAERFLNLYEVRYGSLIPAVDASRVQVDTSIIGHDGARVSALDASADIAIAAEFLGHDDFERIVHVVCLQAPVSHSRFLMVNATGRALEREVDRFLAALDRLAVHWQLATRNAA